MHEDPAPAVAKQELSRGALDDGDAEESERADAIAGGRAHNKSSVSLWALRSVHTYIHMAASSTSEMLYRSQWSRSGLSKCIHVAVDGHHLMPD